MLERLNKKFLTLFIASLCLLIASVIMLCYSVSVTNRQTDIGYDLRSYAVTKVFVNEKNTRMAGTQSGEVFAFDQSGGMLWNAGRLRERAVYDITEQNGEVYVAYADGVVVRFSERAAREFSESETDPTREPLPVTEYRVGYSFHSSGNVKNTQIVAAPDSDDVFLRGMFNDISRVNRIYRLRADGEAVSEYQTSAALGSMALDEEGTLWWTAKNAIWNKRADGAAAQYAETNEALLALSLREGSVWAISENSRLFRFDAADPGNSDAYAVAADIDADFVFSTGKNFLAKAKNGGVLMIDTATHKTAFSMKASADANLIMWTDEGFALRDGSDVTNPRILYYSMELAKSIELFGSLIGAFVAAAAVFALTSLYFGFAMFDKARRVIRRKVKELWKHKFIYLSLLIPLLLLIVFYYIPIAFGFGLSFFEYIPGIKSVFVGLDNFAAVVRSLTFWKSVGTMLVFLLADLVKAIVPPIILAEALFAVKQKRFSLWVRILLFLPGVMPGVATVLVWGQGVFGATSNSLVNGFIGLFVPGFVKNWVYSLSNATAIGTLIAFGFPWIGQYLIFFGAVSGINASVLEASKLDGCGWFRRILKIDLPLILPQIKYVFIMSFIASVQNYTSIYILHGVNGQIQTPALLMYREIINANYGVASAIGMFIFLFLSLATFLNFRMQSDKS